MKRSKRRQNTRHKPIKRHWAIEHLAIGEKLKTTIVGQDDACDRLAGYAASWLVGLELHRPPIAPRILITGPVSGGKSSLVQTLMKVVGGPSTTVNAAMLSPESFKGASTSEVLQNLVSIAGNKDRLERSGAILHIDEFDKLVERANSDQFLMNLSYNLLAILGGEKIYVPPSEYDSGATELDTANVMVILTGAFSKLNRRAFTSPAASQRTLLKLGYPTELVSRISGFINLVPAKKKQMLEIIDRLATEARSTYRMGKDLPEFDLKSVNQIFKIVAGNPLGLRSAKVEIHNLLYESAAKEEIRNLV